MIDNPQTALEANDPIKNAAIRNCYEEEIHQRFDSKFDGAVILVTRRLAHDDLTAHLLATGGWELISLPAVATEDGRFPAAFGDHVLRNKGEALHAARENRDDLRECLLRLGATAFMAQYQQKPYQAGQHGERCGAFHVVPDPNAPREQLIQSPLVFTRVPEETYVLEDVFGEYSCVRPGPPPAMSVEEFMRVYAAGAS